VRLTRNLAIFGGNSQIAKDFIGEILGDSDVQLTIFSRGPEELMLQLEARYLKKFNTIGYEDFHSNPYDVVINFIGASDPNVIACLGNDIVDVTEKFDKQIIEYLQKNPNSIYLYISSGAAYGDVFMRGPANSRTIPNFINNNLKNLDYYGLAKHLSEKRHRLHSNLNIIDIRIFGYAGYWQNIGSRLLIPEIINSIKNQKVFFTDPENIWRDYIGAIEFAEIVRLLIKGGIKNRAIDVYSSSPLNKFDLLDLIKKNYEFRYEMNAKETISGGNKRIYYFSEDKEKLRSLGYTPHRSSYEIVLSALQVNINNAEQ